MKTSHIAALLGFGASALAAEKTCFNDICYTLSIPAATVSSGSGDIYMQITGPTSYSWIGMGQGSMMRGSQMFVIYANANGNNVTLSPRLGVGEVMPQFNSDAKVTLLDGSGVSNGVMTANIKCSSCSSWSGGSMDLKSSSTGWIHAALSGNALKSDSQSAMIRQHSSNSYGTMTFSNKAQGGSSANPFLATSSGSSSSSSGNTASGTSSTGGTTGSTTTSGGTVISSSSAISSANSNGSGMAGFSRRQMILIAHGVMAGSAFAVLFPLGAILIRLLSFRAVVMLHSAFQAFALVVYIVAFGLGVWTATDQGLISEYHPIIGIVVFALLLIQPILGVLHHAAYKKHQTRTFWSRAHVWLGRIILPLGIINGGLGFLLADNTTYGPIVYAVIAAVMYLVYLVAVVIGERRKKKALRAPAQTKYQSYDNSTSASPPHGVSQDYYSRG